MRRYGARDYGYERDFGAGRGDYDRGYRHGWGMVGLHDSIMHGPGPGERGYDHAFRPRGGRGREMMSRDVRYISRPQGGVDWGRARAYRPYDDFAGMRGRYRNR